MEITTKIQIKGIREGLLVTLGDAPWEQAAEALIEHLDQQREFLKGARMALDVGNHVLKAADLGQLRNQISDREVTLWAVISNSPTTERTAQTLGLETRLAKTKPEPAAQDTRYQDGDPAILVHRTLRSGYSLQNPGHVVILGDVNPGAQIISGGDVIVWGRLRGMVHAGAGGNESAVICALDLSPTQLRIAGAIAITPQRKLKPQPETARIVDGQVVAEPWNPKKRE
ncbi:MAG TPA: septum site-determining protein MinC [Anaerolineales bacterium]|nr:septum site-determining protein MinC [Anaerolineales bacterium]